MIGLNQLLQVAHGIKYLNEWQDENGTFIDWILKQGNVVLNKVVTSCGFTSGCLGNDMNVILSSPRIPLLLNKKKQFNMVSKNNPHGIEYCFYFDRNRKVDELKLALGNYFQCCQDPIYSHKTILLVTYDSFSLLADMLERDYHFDISRDFSIVVDAIIKFSTSSPRAITPHHFLPRAQAPLRWRRLLVWLLFLPSNGHRGQQQRLLRWPHSLRLRAGHKLFQ